MIPLDLLRIFVILGAVAILAIPAGKYLALAYSLDRTPLDRWFGPVENVVYRLSGVNSRISMSWQKIAWNFLFMVMLFAIIGFALLRLQPFTPLNPDDLAALEPTLAFNTAISFATHSQLQHYSGEVALSNFTQMAFVLFMMFGPVATGMSIAMPMLRGFTGQAALGNFHQDIVRTIVRVALPLSFIMTLVFVWLGMPQTLTSKITVDTLEGGQQIIATGPVAVIESIKQFASNGGGFFGANAAHPYENPSPLSNVIHLVAMLLIPGSLVVMTGHMLGNRRQGWVLFAGMMAILVAMTVAITTFEVAGNPAQERAGLSQVMGNMEGKELRFGAQDSALFTAITAATTTGAVNTMHDALTPLSGMVVLQGILMNTVFGETGAGIINIFLYLVLTVFVSGLLVGRTPELFGKRIENREVKLVVKELLLLPVLILLPTVIALFTASGTAGITNPGPHGFTQIFYEYASSAANNGSGFEGLADNSPFWNITTGIVMLIGRCLPMIIMLAIAASLHRKQTVPVTTGTVRTDSVTFAVIFVATVLIVGSLSYFPFLALGPISEWLLIR